MKHITKSISIVLALLMLTSVFAVVPITANATDISTYSTGKNSGTTGECEWSFDSSTGELTISGNGSMASYGEETPTPWSEFRNEIKKVSILSGVKNIGSCSFYGYKNLNEISIAESVNKIEYYAFDGTAFFKNDENWTNGALYIDSFLISTNENIPEHFYVKAGTTVIADYAFAYKYNLNTIEIPESVINIGENTFEYCTNIENINVSLQNNVYSSKNGNLYNKNKTEFIKYALAKSDTTFSMPDEVEQISKYAFYNCEYLESIILSNKVSVIGESAFMGCSNLKSINIPYEVKYIEKAAFHGCSSLSEITLSDNIVRIGDMAFYYCSSLKMISIPNKIESIGYGAFLHCKEIKSVTLPNTITNIGDEAFGYYQKEDSDNIQKIDDFTIYGYSGTVAEIYANNNGFKFESLGQAENNSDFTYTPLDENTIEITGYIGNNTNIVIPNEIKGLKVVKIKASAFENNENIENIALPENITEISYKLFSGCVNVKSVVIPDNVTKICEQAFYECTNLESITLPDKLKEINDFAFYRCQKLKSVDIPETVETLGKSAFDSCSSLTSVVIPDNITEISEQVFNFCSSLKDVKIGKNVEIIGAYAFQGCDRLVKIILPVGVKKIRWFAFSCDNLAFVSIPNTVKTIEQHAFSYRLNHVFYMGNEEDWNNIQIDENNDYLINATRHYNEYDIKVKFIKTVAPDCKNMGYDLYKCEICGDELKANYTDVIGHIYINDVCTMCGERNPETTDSTKPTENPSETTTPAPKLKKSSVSLKAGQTSTITVQNKGDNKIRYKSSNSKVATVKNGKVTALKKGKSNITVTVGKTKLTYKVNVTTSPKLSKKSVSVKKGKTVTVKITGKASGVNNKYTNTKFAKIKSKKSATSLKIQGLKKGKTTLKVKVNGVVLKLKVTVR